MTEIDRSLFDAAKMGNRVAFDELVGQIQPELKAFCLSRVGDQLRSFVEIDDIIQETSLKAFESIEAIRWQGERALFSWFCGVAQNVIYAQSRKSLRIGSPSEDVDGPDEIGSSPSQRLRRGERFDRLERSLNMLTEEQRQVVRLTRIEGLSIREAAARMDRTEKTTYQLLWRAIKKLREVLGETASMRLPRDRSLGPQGPT